MIKRKQSRLLVESILKGNTQKADKILAKLISEAEDDREAEAAKEAGVQPDEEEGGNADEADDFEAEDLEGSTEGEDEFEELDDPVEDDQFSPEGQDETAQVQTDTELNDAVDKQVKFEVQINNLVCNDLQNLCADLKTRLESDSALDKHSREYYEIKVPLQYYAEHLTGMGKDITPLVNQDEIKKQLDEIKSALEELSSKIGGGESEPISTPNQIVDQELGESEF